MSNRTRKNNKRADKKMESNDSPDIPDSGSGETSEEPGLLLSQKNARVCGRILKALNIHERTRRREIIKTTQKKRTY